MCVYFIFVHSKLEADPFSIERKKEIINGRNKPGQRKYLYIHNIILYIRAPQGFYSVRSPENCMM